MRERFQLMIIRGRVQRKHAIRYRMRREGYMLFRGLLYIGADVFRLERTK